MAKTNTSSQKRSDYGMLLTRDIGAPRRLVFEAWINPEQFAQWWGPDGFTNQRCELDVRPAGAIRIDTRAPDGTVYRIGGFYQEIVEFEKLVFSSSVLDGLGHPLVDVLNTITFADGADGTTLTVQVRVLRSTEESIPFLEAMEPGWKQSLERLRAYLALISTKPV
jgi:uncharacterized protein YndB with AHSA1/START domain